MQHAFVSHLNAATATDATMAVHAAHEPHATLLVLGTHVRHELLGNAEVFPGLLGSMHGTLLVRPSLLGSMLGSILVRLCSLGMSLGSLGGLGSLCFVLHELPELPPLASLLVMVLGDASMMTSDLVVPVSPLGMDSSLLGVCFRSLAMSLGYFRGFVSSLGVGMGSFLKMGSLLGHVLVALLGFVAAVGKADAPDVAPNGTTEGRLVLGQSGLRNHVFLLNGGFGGDKGDADGGGNDQRGTHC